MDTTTIEHRIPADIAEIYSTLGWLLSDLSDLMSIEVKEWRGELRQAVKEWKGGGVEPDWQGFRDQMNEICRDDGMPILFLPPEAPDAHLEAAYEDRICGGCDD